MNKEEYIEQIENASENNYDKTRELSNIIFQAKFSDHSFINTDGAGDCGIDYYEVKINPEGDRTWNIVQTKYGSAYRGLDTVCGDLGKLQTLLQKSDVCGKEDVVYQLRKFIELDTESDKSINIFIFTCDKIDQGILNILAENWTALFKVSINISNISLDHLIEEEKVKEVLKDHVFELKGNFLDDNESQKTQETIGKVSYPDLYNFMSSYEYITGNIYNLLDDNVRYGMDTKPARDARDTYSNEPGEMFCRSNGGCLTVDSWTYNKDTHILRLINPSLPNGGSCSIKIYNHIKNTGEIHEEAMYPLKIVGTVGKTKENKEKIPYCLNNSKSVKDENFLGMDDRSISIKNTLKKLLGVDIQLKEGELKYKERLDPKDLSRSIKLRDLFLTSYAVFTGHPGKVYSNSGEIIRLETLEANKLLTDLSTDEKLLHLSYLLANICRELRKKTCKYYINNCSYHLTCLVFEILNLIYPREKEDWFDKCISILEDEKKRDCLLLVAYVLLFEYTDTKTNTIKRGLFKDYKETIGNLNAGLKKVKFSSPDGEGIASALISKMIEWSKSEEGSEKIKLLLK